MIAVAANTRGVGSKWLYCLGLLVRSSFVPISSVIRPPSPGKLGPVGLRYVLRRQQSGLESI
jgi:hypothetical protein